MLYKGFRSYSTPPYRNLKRRKWKDWCESVKENSVRSNQKRIGGL